MLGIIILLYFAQARDLVGTSRTQISLMPALDEWMIFLSHFQILQKLRFQCLYFGIFFLHASLRKLKLIIFWLIIMFIYLWFQFEWTRRCVCAGAEWAVCGGPGVSAGLSCSCAQATNLQSFRPCLAADRTAYTHSIECIFRSGNHFATASKSHVFLFLVSRVENRN